jgi:UDP-3-O-[3-hydroxymyristoyl] glucosamine N-acyltransferase
VLLSKVSGLVSADILRDGEFSALGMLSHDADRMLVVLYDPNYLNRLIANPHITCVFTNPDLAPLLPERLAVAVSDDPTTAFYEVHSYLFKQTDFYGTDFDSEIAPSAVVHERAYVAPKNVRIGDRSFVEPNATILDRAIIGEDVIIRAGAVISGEGYEPKLVGGKLVMIPHAGGVLLHNRVEVQANSHIQRAVFGGFTEVGEDSKIGALAQIGHHVRIGRRSKIAGSTPVLGSTIIGDDVWVGPNAAISSGLKIGDGAYITVGAVVTRDVPAGQRVSGNFAIEHSRFLSFIKSIR